jgi:hypothetical protein
VYLVDQACDDIPGLVLMTPVLGKCIQLADFLQISIKTI